MHSKLVAIMAESIGELSMCWEKPERAGKFLSEEAHKIIERTVKEIEELYNGQKTIRSQNDSTQSNENRPAHYQTSNQ